MCVVCDAYIICIRDDHVDDVKIIDSCEVRYTIKQQVKTAIKYQHDYYDGCDGGKGPELCD